MSRTLIYYMPEYYEVAEKLRDNYIEHKHKEVDIISETEQDDIAYAREKQYDEAIFIEDSNVVVIHDIKSGYTERLSVADVYYKDH